MIMITIFASNHNNKTCCISNNWRKSLASWNNMPYCHDYKTKNGSLSHHIQDLWIDITWISKLIVVKKWIKRKALKIGILSVIVTEKFVHTWFANNLSLVIISLSLTWTKSKWDPNILKITILFFLKLWSLSVF